MALLAFFLKWEESPNCFCFVSLTEKRYGTHYRKVKRPSGIAFRQLPLLPLLLWLPL